MDGQGGVSRVKAKCVQNLREVRGRVGSCVVYTTVAAGEAGRVNRTRPRRGGPMAMGSPDMLRTALLRVLERGLV